MGIYYNDVDFPEPIKLKLDEFYYDRSEISWVSANLIQVGETVMNRNRNNFSVSIFMVAFHDPLNFYFTVAPEFEKFEIMGIEMRIFEMNALKNDGLLERNAMDLFFDGAIVAILFGASFYLDKKLHHEKDNWHRGQLIQELSYKKAWLVFLVDFGELLKIEKKDMYKLKRKYIVGSPFQAVPSKIAVKGTSLEDLPAIKWPKEIITCFHNEMANSSPASYRETIQTDGIDKAKKKGVIAFIDNPINTTFNCYRWTTDVYVLRNFPPFKTSLKRILDEEYQRSKAVQQLHKEPEKKQIQREILDDSGSEDSLERVQNIKIYLTREFNF